MGRVLALKSPGGTEKGLGQHLRKGHICCRAQAAKTVFLGHAKGFKSEAVALLKMHISVNHRGAVPMK